MITIIELQKIINISLRLKEDNGKKRLALSILFDNGHRVDLDKKPKEINELITDWKKILKDYEKGTKLFQINDYITLKLEGSRTNIYVKGKKFNQCKYLLLDVPIEDLDEINEIQSIDEASEKLDRTHEYDKALIEPETAFWGHCSNLQAWVESQYDTRLLHRNLAFPLLKRLTEVGDPIARKIYKDEIAERLEAGEKNVFMYLNGGGYLKVFNNDELLLIVDNIKNQEIRNTIFNQLRRKGVSEANDLFKKDLIKKLIKGDREAYTDLSDYGDLLSNEEREEIAPQVENPILRMLLIMHILIEEIPEIRDCHIDKDLIIRERKNAFLICAYTNNLEIELPYYYESKSIYGKISGKLVGNKKLIDLGIAFKKRSVVFPMKYITLARKIMNRNKDIQIQIPIEYGHLRIFSKSENLKMFIEPILLG